MILPRHTDVVAPAAAQPVRRSIFDRSAHAARAFKADTRGTTMVIFGMVLVPAVFLVGMAVDYGRTSNARAKLQGAADAAALATLNMPGLDDAERAALAAKVFAANVAGDAYVSQVVPSIDTTGGPTVVTAGKDVPSAFLKVMGINTLRIDVKATAENATAAPAANTLEVALMIDLTGSMGQTRNGATKFAGLQAASADLLDTLFPGGATTSSTTKVGIVPMADFVNAGVYASQVTGLPSTGTYDKLNNMGSTKTGSYGNLPYSGAGGGSGGGHGATSAGTTYSNGHCTNGTQFQVVQGYTVGVGAQNGSAYGNYASYWKTEGNRIYYLLRNGNYNPVYTGTCSNSADQTGSLITCVTERVGADAYTDDAPASGSRVGAYNQGRGSLSNYSSDGKCHVAGRELPSIIPLTNNKVTLTDFFSKATIGGGTPGHLGHAWAWYMLSPEWNSVWPTDSEPKAYGTSGLKKAAVIMTDGEYNEQYSTESSRNQALALCTAMKAKGIHVYTIGFGFSASPAAGSTEANAKDLLTQCSSGANHYYFPYDSAALKTAFKTIAGALTSNPQSAPKVRMTN